jgi:hypothetical protein
MVTIPGWQIAGEPTVVRYGQHTDGVTGTAGDARGGNPAGTFPTDSTPGPTDRGRQLFVGGAVGDDTLMQTVSLAKAVRAIAGGSVQYTLSGWLGGNETNNSTARVSVTFLSATGAHLGAATLGPVTAVQRLLQTKLLDTSSTGTIPRGSRSAVITLTMTDGTRQNDFPQDSYNNAYADDLALHISAATPAPSLPPPPQSTVGRLQHVFMVFMENEGDGDIVGDSGAPYLNRLIDQHGFAADYHGLAHPSDPNYIAFFGGSTFGIDDDCVLACTVNQRNLADQIEAAHKSWRFYEQTMPSPCYHGTAGPSGPPGPNGGTGGPYYSPDELPWAYFSDLADNARRCQAHVFPYGQITKDLASTRTTPNYVWFEADDCQDMEQCGITSGDQWLSGTVPQIMNSPAFKKQRSAIFITFDEDFNNKSFNQDNEDQRIPMIVIGSPKSGLRTGRLQSDAYYTHYGLLRTVQATLGLPDNLSLNDSYATPLNAFWPAVPHLSRLRISRPHGRLTIRYRDSGASRVTLVLKRGQRKLGSFAHSDRGGSVRVRLPRRLARRIRRAGRYTLRITPANAAGVTGRAVNGRFRVRRSSRRAHRHSRSGRR